MEGTWEALREEKSMSKYTAWKYFKNQSKPVMKTVEILKICHVT